MLCYDAKLLLSIGISIDHCATNITLIKTIFCSLMIFNSLKVFTVGPADWAVHSVMLIQCEKHGGWGVVILYNTINGLLWVKNNIQSYSIILDNSIQPHLTFSLLKSSSTHPTSCSSGEVMGPQHTPVWTQFLWVYQLVCDWCYSYYFKSFYY